MALTRKNKEDIVSTVTSKIETAVSLVTADYNGLTAQQLEELRRLARDAKVYLKVVPNNLMKMVVKQNETFKHLADHGEMLAGPNIFAFSLEEPGAAARLLRSFSKEHEKLKVRMLAVSGQVLPASSLNMLADLPTRDQAIAQVMGVMKAPIGKLVGTLVAPYEKLVRTVAAVGDQKRAA